MEFERDELMLLWDALEQFVPEYQDPTAELNRVRIEALMQKIEEAVNGN